MRLAEFESIASDQNPLIKLARKLSRSSHARRKAAATLLDGPHLIEAYGGRFRLETGVLLVSQSARGHPQVAALSAQFGWGRRVILPEPLFQAISPVETPTGIAALVDIPNVAPPAGHADQHWLLLDGIQDPGNLGSILRSAAATGITLAVVSERCADVWSPKCLRGGMGAQFVLPCRSGKLTEELKAFTGRRIATAPRIGQPLPNCDLTGPVALLFGGEGAGLPADLLSLADAVAHIPLATGIESLNVAAAVAMVCYERQRQASATR